MPEFKRGLGDILRTLIPESVQKFFADAYARKHGGILIEELAKPEEVPVMSPLATIQMDQASFRQTEQDKKGEQEIFRKFATRLLTDLDILNLLKTIFTDPRASQYFYIPNDLIQSDYKVRTQSRDCMGDYYTSGLLERNDTVRFSFIFNWSPELQQIIEINITCKQSSMPNKECELTFLIAKHTKNIERSMKFSLTPDQPLNSIDEQYAAVKKQALEFLGNVFNSIYK